ncbi:ribose-5-phosphate isomerase RpiA [Candidatus Bathyarchaeota archaeon]|nr:ribose-5-phosphate isomerase RpiA [Candidatus Bathyarchaeota archaeon]MBL7078940.1 ribose-5-phosphate isomerase RpiA [Candidatus Bathyarchaeota archaeon]
MSWVDGAKRRAAEAAARHVKSGTVIGLGTGSTAKHLIQIIGAYLSEGKLTEVQGVPTSNQTAADALEAGIPLTTLDDHPELTLSIDGADLIDGDLNAIKGGGGALLREKIVASASKTYILIADETKIVEKLGTGFPLPIEILPFSAAPTADRVGKLGASVALRRGKLGPVTTDNGNFILDADFGPIDDPAGLERELKSIPGVLETGLFLGYADFAYVGTPDGVRKLER